MKKPHKPKKPCPFPPKLNVENIRIRVDFETIHKIRNLAWGATDDLPGRGHTIETEARK